MNTEMVKINVEQLKKDLVTMGITQEAVGIRLGRSRSWLGNILAVGATNAETVRKIEEVLFKPVGHYEIKAKEEKKEVPADNNEAVKLLQEIVKNLSVIRAQNEELLSAIHAWRKTNTDQNAKMIEKSTEHITQQLKTRSLLERRLSNETL